MYEGEFQENRFEGKGDYKIAGGKRYVGQYHNNKMHG